MHTLVEDKSNLEEDTFVLVVLVMFLCLEGTSKANMYIYMAKAKNTGHKKERDETGSIIELLNGVC
jgi:hypothetical protein